MFRILLIFACLIAQNARVLAETIGASACNSEVPFLFPAAPEVATVSTLHFVSTFGLSKVGFLFTNISSRRVVSLLMAVELFDRSDHRMFDVPFHAYVPSLYRSTSISRTYDTGWVIQLERPLLSGESRHWDISSPFFSMRCPFKAHISFLQIEYDNGPNIEYSDPHVYRDPLAVDASYLELSGAPFKVPLDVMTTLKISKSGYLESISINTPGFAALQQWLQEKIHSWGFSPAFSDGVPVDAELKILFRFHSHTPKTYPTPPNLNQDSDSVFQVADIFPPEPGKRLWRVYLGRSVLSNRAMPEDSNSSNSSRKMPSDRPGSRTEIE